MNTGSTIIEISLFYGRVIRVNLQQRFSAQYRIVYLMATCYKRRFSNNPSSCCEFLKPIQKLVTWYQTQSCTKNRSRWHVTRGSIFYDTVLRQKLLLQVEQCNMALNTGSKIMQIPDFYQQDGHVYLIEESYVSQRCESTSKALVKRPMIVDDSPW